MVDSGIGPRNRLWTPWRMTYISGAAPVEGCVFCQAPNAGNDADLLILHRGEHYYVILNLYPYNTGHLMVVPYDHVNRPDMLSPEARAEMAEVSASLSHGLTFVMGCEGMNIGMNLGSAAGAGIADHLHQHMVPRWVGDANFMPLIGGTKVLPELLPATYGKIRAEICRQKTGEDALALVVLDDDGIWLDRNALPAITADAETPLWKAAARSLGTTFETTALLGWSGADTVEADASEPPALAHEVASSAAPQIGWQHMSFAQAEAHLGEPDRARLRAALRRFRAAAS